MTFTQGLILLATILITAYLLGLFYISGRIATFRKDLNKSVTAVNLILSQKREVLLGLAKVYREHDIPFKDNDDVLLTKVRWLKTQGKHANELNEVNSLLKEFEKRLSYLQAKSPDLSKNEEASWLLDSLNDLNFNYRRVSAIYNSLVTGFNYWRVSLLYRPIFSLFTKKETSLT